MIILAIIITSIYLCFIGALLYGFYRINIFNTERTKNKTTFSIIVPFRNEAKNLKVLLDSIVKLQYLKTHFEILFVDDDSTDNSVTIITKHFKNQEINFKIIKNNRISNSPKKDAITSAINNAKNDWIITTDADCKLPVLWLDTFNAFILKTKSKMVIAPVAYHNTNTFIQQFQLIDFLSLMGATIGGFGINKPFLCNGANFAYLKSWFLDLKGFSGNENIASGDDIFLLQKAIEKDKTAVNYLKSKNAIVKTKAQPTVSTLVSQRKRWAAKTSSYNSIFGKVVGLIVLLMNATIVISLVLSMLQLFSVRALIFIFVLKSIIDFLLIYKSADFFSQKKHLSGYILSAFIYPFFTVYIALISMFSKYKWKGRTFKK